MNRATFVCITLSVLNVLLVGVFILTMATLIQERSRDIVRVTVDSSQLLPTVGQLQLATGKYARAYPVNADESKWRVVVDNRSKSF